MSRTTFALALAAVLSIAPTLGAQQQPPAGAPGRRPMPGRDRQFGPMGPGGMGPGAPMTGGGSPAEMLLAHTGELRLTDQQVVRLAAIARRADDRRRAFRTRMDSLRATFRPDSTRPRARFAPGGAAGGGPLATQLTQMRDQARTDLRDALTVLTPDQQAQAWEMAARRGRGGMMGAAAMRRGRRGGAGMGMRRGMAPGQGRMRRPGGEEQQQ